MICIRIKVLVGELGGPTMHPPQGDMRQCFYDTLDIKAWENGCPQEKNTTFFKMWVNVQGVVWLLLDI